MNGSFERHARAGKREERAQQRRRSTEGGDFRAMAAAGAAGVREGGGGMALKELGQHKGQLTTGRAAGVLQKEEGAPAAADRSGGRSWDQCPMLVSALGVG